MSVMPRKCGTCQWFIGSAALAEAALAEGVGGGGGGSTILLFLQPRATSSSNKLEVTTLPPAALYLPILFFAVAPAVGASSNKLELPQAVCEECGRPFKGTSPTSKAAKADAARRQQEEKEAEEAAARAEAARRQQEEKEAHDAALASLLERVERLQLELREKDTEIFALRQENKELREEKRVEATEAAPPEAAEAAPPEAVRPLTSDLRTSQESCADETLANIATIEAIISEAGKVNDILDL
ncbi:uncharacterized protein LOC108677437 [Hyalella azteca]|uniref:Uncharacterized protein LOC108677437 n=1 Tax=Hyalella azteca TaxID=294128 RepID=A0A8B7P4T1_HYAAZ|nr:uncharacterized protein LOC108677437 [Hyalella azteca]